MQKRTSLVRSLFRTVKPKQPALTVPFASSCQRLRRFVHPHLVFNSVPTSAPILNGKPSPPPPPSQQRTDIPTLPPPPPPTRSHPSKPMASLSLPLPSSANIRAAKSRPTSGSSTCQRVPVSSSKARQRPWWSPLFPAAPRDEAGPGEPAGTRRSRLTEEKARVLRREMRATESWHDAMYHSAIATRLASPEDHQPSAELPICYPDSPSDRRFSLYSFLPTVLRKFDRM